MVEAAGLAAPAFSGQARAATRKHHEFKVQAGRS